jgi:hypothetical protein
MTKLEICKNNAIEEIKEAIANNDTTKPFKFSNKCSKELKEALEEDFPQEKIKDVIPPAPITPTPVPTPAPTPAINWSQFIANAEQLITFAIQTGSQILPFITQIIALFPKTSGYKPPFGQPLTPEDHHPAKRISKVKSKE